MTALTPPDAPAIRLVTGADPASLAGVDAIIDTRSPDEFAEDHVPGAISLPVLSNEERAVVGTLYVRSRFEARRLGAALVARNIAAHLERALADKPDNFRPLVYCWRGGQRSHAMATILSQVGWRTSLLQGGYKTYRRYVQTRLYDDPAALSAILIDGDTGTGKTEMLARLAERGLQTLDLEGLANHRGSLLGGRGAQPSQKLFESRLLGALEALDPARPIVMEAESSKVGERMIPPLVWRAMQAAPRITLQAEPEQRARYLVTAYGDIIEDRAALEAALDRLPFRASPERRTAWTGWIEAGEHERLARALMELHYDPAYARSARRDTHFGLGTLPCDPTDAASMDETAGRIVDVIRGWDVVNTRKA